MNYPDWVLKHKKKGTEIRKIGGRYYIYKITSVWDKNKKRPKKITEKFLGTIKEEGFTKPKCDRLMEGMKNVSVREFGAANLVLEMNKDIKENLKLVYPERWKEIFLFSLFRFLHNTPIKNLQVHYSSSFVSEKIKGANLSPKNISSMLREIGMHRGSTNLFMKHLMPASEFMIIDLTHVFSLSKDVVSSMPGYNSKKEFDPQIHMNFIFSIDHQMPAYFRIVPGSVQDVSSLVLTVRESGVENVVLIGDKGFYSAKNVDELEKESVKYILPLKRDSSLIDYSKVEKGKQTFDGYFVFEKRVVWYSNHILEGGRKVILFLDERLKAEEEKDYISRMDEREGDIKDFFKTQHKQGTISVITNFDSDGEKVYNLLKTRSEIETMIDAFKNILEADRTYMRDDFQMEGWMLINFISLLFYYKVYGILMEKRMLKKHSPKDVLLHLSRIHKLKINGEWVTSEIPKKSREIVEKLEVPIT